LACPSGAGGDAIVTGVERGSDLEQAAVTDVAGEHHAPDGTLLMSGPDTESATVTWPLMGRDEQLEAFAQALADEQRQGFIISGHEGAGKSRLAQECLKWAAGAGFRVMRALTSTTAVATPPGAIDLLPTGVELSVPSTGHAVVAGAMAQDGRRLVVLVDE